MLPCNERGRPSYHGLLCKLSSLFKFRSLFKHIPRASIHHENELEASYLLPWEAFQRGVFPDLFQELDEKGPVLGVKCYGVMDSTLEEVSYA